MSFVIAAPEMVRDAATNLASLGSTISAANAAAATPTTALVAAGTDEVSAAIASFFSQHASAYQAVSARAAGFHAQFVQMLGSAAGAYSGTEATNVEQALLGEFRQTLQQTQPARQRLLAVINAPTESLLGRPLIGNGYNGITTPQGVGTPGGAGGILWGRGGNGGDSIAAGVPGGAGGPAGLLGTGGGGGMGGWGAPGGAGGTGGWLHGNGGPGGIGGPYTRGGAGGRAWLFGKGGGGGLGGELGGVGGRGGHGGFLVGDGGPGGTGGVSGGPGGVPGGPGGSGGLGGLFGVRGTAGATGGAPTIPMSYELLPYNSPTNLVPREVVNISIAGGPRVPVIVDTGSEGILVPPQDVNFATLGAPTATGLTTPHYGFGNNYDVFTYNTYTAPVNMGNGIVTAPTTIGVMTSGTQYSNGVPSPINLTYATPKMGVGLNTQVVVAANPIQALPGTLAQGVLLNNPGNALQFGANPFNYYASVPGAPISNAPYISITDPTTAISSVPSNAHGYIDSGGIQGGLPSSALPSTQTGDKYVPSGDIVSFYNGDPSSGGTLLYTYTVSGSNPPVFPVTPPNPPGFNSGIIPFSGSPGYGLVNGALTPAPNGIPIYVSYSPSYGTMYFDY